jgi:hypothetical protein
VTGRNRTCAPRFSSGRSTWLSYSHAFAHLNATKPSGEESRVVAAAERRRGVRRKEPAARASRARRALHGRGWNRTSDLLFVRQALCAAELLALVPGQGLEPRSPRSERDVLPFRRSRSVVASLSRPTGKRRTMFSKPLAYPSTLDRRAPTERAHRPTWRSSGARARAPVEKLQAKAHANVSATFQRKRRGLSLSGGASIPI